VTSPPFSVADLALRGSDQLAHYRERERPPATPLEWLGIAVAYLPELSARARTADEVHWHSRTQSVKLRAPLLEALADALAVATATVEEARHRLLERHPAAAASDDAAEPYAELLEGAHRSAPRRAEMMIGGYASFLGGAVETAGCLAEAELAIACARRWDRIDHERLVEVRAAQLHTALSNALGGLLAYARLVAEDSSRLQD
jgi:hypothetical protein